MGKDFIAVLFNIFANKYVFPAHELSVGRKHNNLPFPTGDGMNYESEQMKSFPARAANFIRGPRKDA